MRPCISRGQAQGKEFFRVKVLSAPTYREMKMRACGSACCTTQADFLPRFDVIPCFNVEFRQMQIQGQQTLPVVNEHAIPFEIKRLGEQYSPAVQSFDERPLGHAEIEALMHALYRAVKLATRAENVRDSCVHGRLKRACPKLSVRSLFKLFLFDAFVASNLLQLFGIGLGELFRHREGDHNFVRTFFDTDRLFERDRTSGSCLPGKPQSVSSRIRLQADSGEGIPSARRGIVGKRQRLRKPGSAQCLDPKSGGHAKEYGRSIYQFLRLPANTHGRRGGSCSEGSKNK